MMLCVLLAVSFVTLCACMSHDEVVDLAHSNTAFGFNLLNSIQDDEGGNVFLSPFSISTALAMTYLGAGGNTKNQLATGLQIKNYSNPAKLFQNLYKRLFQKQDNDGYTLRQANRLYGDKHTKFKNRFLNDVRKYFSAPVSKVDFTLPTTLEDINLWVEEQTDQKIKNLLADGDLNGAILVLINAIYLKALWLKPFNSRSTYKDDFNITPTRSMKVDMMHHSSPKKFNIGTIPGLNAKILEMKYKGEAASMFIILPDESSGLCEVQEGLTINKLEEAITQMKEKVLRIKVPKFELKDRIQLKKYLSKLNMTDMFDSSKADFSNITNDGKLSISKVIHQAFVRVHEAGTEAAAATAVIILRTSLQMGDPFYVNRPFLFFIRDLTTKSMLFLGRVVDPTDEEVLGSDGYQCKQKTMLYSTQKNVAPVVYTHNGVGIPVQSTCAVLLSAIIGAFVSKF